MSNFKAALEWASKKEEKSRPSIVPYLAAGATGGVGIMFLFNFLGSRMGSSRSQQSQNPMMMQAPQYRMMPPMGYPMRGPAPALASPLRPGQ